MQSFLDALEKLQRRRDSDWSIVETEIDDRYEASMQRWKALGALGVFPFAMLFFAIMLFFDWKFAYSMAGDNVSDNFIALLALLAAADTTLIWASVYWAERPNPPGIPQPKKNNGLWYVLATICTVVSCMVVIGSTSELATRVAAKNTAAVDTRQDLIDKRNAFRDKLKALPQETESVQALIDQARYYEGEAEKEKSPRRGGCGPKCDAHTKQAFAFRARAANAQARIDLLASIEAINEEVGGMANLRTTGNTLADFFENLSVSQGTTEKWAMSWFGLFAVFVYLILCGRLSSDLTGELQKRANKNGKIADAMRRDHGMPPKYMAPEPEALLETDYVPEEMKDMSEVERAEKKMFQRFPNDDALVEANSLFSRILEGNGVATTTFQALYQAYEEDCKRARPGQHYQPKQQLRAKLEVVAQYRPDVQIKADGRMPGWQIKPIEAMPKLIAVNG